METSDPQQTRGSKVRDCNANPISLKDAPLSTSTTVDRSLVVDDAEHGFAVMEDDRGLAPADQPERHPDNEDVDAFILDDGVPLGRDQLRSVRKASEMLADIASGLDAEHGNGLAMAVHLRPEVGRRAQLRELIAHRHPVREIVQRLFGSARRCIHEAPPALTFLGCALGAALFFATLCHERRPSAQGGCG